MPIFRRLALGVLLPCLLFTPARGEAAQPQKEGYIVVFRASVGPPADDIRGLEKSLSFDARFSYKNAVKGFAARLDDRQVSRLRRDPEVAFVTRDRKVTASAPLVSGDTAPLGVRRLGAAVGSDVRAASPVNVAVIDSGVDLGHPDLNVTSGIDCVNPGTSAQDDNGHGTHVAGSIGARNNGSGVVGVAPGTKLFAVKVLSAQGSGTHSQVICGIDWVAGTRTDSDATNDIAVANMSLGGPTSALGTCATTSDAQHRAICNATAKGVTFVVAAGNSARSFDSASQPDAPAAYPEVLTVTAVADSDGRGGTAGAAPNCRGGESDDRYASFSNYATTAAGQGHSIAAPGVCIVSTALGGGTTTMSGTSMASPHVAGAVALCLGEGSTAGPCSGMTPAQTVQKMRADAAAFNNVAANLTHGFTGDPLRPVSGRYFGFLPWAGTAATVPPPPPRVAVVPTSATVETGSLRNGGASRLAADDNLFYEVSSDSAFRPVAAWYGTFTGLPPTLNRLRVAYRGKASATCSETISIWRWSDSSWVALNSRSAGTSEVEVSNLAPPDPSGAYVAGGQLRIGVRCTSPSFFGGPAFFTSGDQLEISYESDSPPPPPPTDSTRPTIDSVTPSGGATDVATGAAVSVAFSEPMNAAETQAAFTLVRASNSAPVAGTFSWSANTLRFTPASPLEPGTDYTARVSTRAKDVAGNALAADRVWTFRTAAAPPPPSTGTTFPSAVTIEAGGGSLRSGGASQLNANDDQFYQVNSSATLTPTTSWFGSFTGVPATAGNLRVTYSGSVSAACTQTISIWRWSDSTWVQLDSRNAGTSEIEVADLSPPGAASGYLSGGQARVRIRCAKSFASFGSGAFFASGELLKLTHANP